MGVRVRLEVEHHLQRIRDGKAAFEQDHGLAKDDAEATGNDSGEERGGEACDDRQSDAANVFEAQEEEKLNLMS